MLLAGVFALKAGLALTLADHPLLQPVGALDGGEYWRLAQRVADGDVLLRDTAFYVSPLYIYVLALLQRLAGASVAGVLLLQALLGTVAVWMVGHIARRWSTPEAGVLAAALLAATGVIALQEATILQSSIDPLLTAGFLLAFTIALQRGTPRDWAWCGAALATCGLNRPHAFALAMLCVPAALQRDAARPRAVASVVLGAALVLAPFALRTGLVTGAWHVLPGHGGLNLYIGNHAGATGTYTVLDGIRPSIDGQREDTRAVAEAAEGRRLSDAEVSAHFVRRAWEWWQAHPLDAIRLSGYKAWLALHATELPVNVSYAWFRAETWLLRLMPVGAWLLLPLAAAACAAGSLGIAAPNHGGWRWFRLVVPVYLASVVVTFVVDRYRAPALVMAAVVASPLLAEVWARRGAMASGLRVPAWRAVAAGLGVLLMALVPLPFDLGEADADTRMALHAIEGGRDDEARTWLARAVAGHPAPGVAQYRAGLAWQARAAWPDAERALREAWRLDADVPDVAFALAGVLLSQGKGAEAVPLLEIAARAGVRPDRVELDLALARWQAGDRDAARATLARGIPVAGHPLWRARALAAVDARQGALATWLLDAYRRVAPDDAEVAESLGLVLAGQDQLEAAATQFEDAARLDARRATARFNLAVVRARQGRRDEARALLRDALRIEPGYTQAAGALRELTAPGS